MMLGFVFGSPAAAAAAAVAAVVVLLLISLLPVGLLMMYMMVESLSRNCMEEPPDQKCTIGEALDQKC